MSFWRIYATLSTISSGDIRIHFIWSISYYAWNFPTTWKYTYMDQYEKQKFWKKKYFVLTETIKRKSNNWIKSYVENSVKFLDFSHQPWAGSVVIPLRLLRLDWDITFCTKTDTHLKGFFFVKLVRNRLIWKQISKVLSMLFTFVPLGNSGNVPDKWYGMFCQVRCPVS